jgi:metallophosphoesterase (TIGR00282 family)
MNVLVVGDIVGKAGLDAIKNFLPKLKEQYILDFIVVNGENSADGMGITKNILYSLYDLGVDVVTMGNHTWGKKDIFSFIDEEKKLIRPANYATGIPGRGSTIVFCKSNNKKIGVVNLIGRVNMGANYDSPFEVADKEIEKLKSEHCDIIIVDFHAEATAEKIALSYYLKNKVNIFFGSHTHVQTADEKIYDTGMGYITDVGMTGPKNSIIGMDIDVALKRFLTQIPERYITAEGDHFLNGILFEIDDSSNKTINVTRINM